MTLLYRCAWTALAFGLITACDVSSNPGMNGTVPVASAEKPMPAMAASASAATPSEDPSRDVAHADEFHEFNLTIFGYNYTDTEIGSFEVNGHGGGNLAVSTPTSAGGSSVCCFPLFTPIKKDRPIRLKWSRDGEMWCEQDVVFNGPVPLNAKYLEVHFYREGRIDIAATSSNSAPRLKLDRVHGNSRHSDQSLNISNDTKFSRCKHGYR